VADLVIGLGREPRRACTSWLHAGVGAATESRQLLDSRVHGDCLQSPHTLGYVLPGWHDSKSYTCETYHAY